jgi:hypothetical protein
MSSGQIGRFAESSAAFECMKNTAGEPAWIREMKKHFLRKGYFRAEDLRRLLGDPCKGVEMSAGESVAAHFQQ